MWTRPRTPYGWRSAAEPSGRAPRADCALPRRPDLIEQGGHRTDGHGSTAFADGEAEAGVHRHRGTERHLHLHRLPRPDLGQLAETDRPGYVGGAEVELGPVVRLERRVPT